MKVARNIPPEFGNVKELNNRLVSKGCFLYDVHFINFIHLSNNTTSMDIRVHCLLFQFGSIKQYCLPPGFS
jgi:hypothetical protein